MMATMQTDDQTIAAIGTAPGEGGISIVRVSGPEALTMADRFFRGRGKPPSARRGGTFVHGYTVHEGQDVDEVLLLIMRAPHSYTCEDMVEIQGHGGVVSARRNLRAALAAGAQLAEPGAFTRRAFLNGRLDLLQAEAVLDLIKARSERAATSALEQLEGSLSSSFTRIYDLTLDVAADVEATLDFPEDELPETVLPEIAARLATIHAELSRLVESWDEGRLLREGAKVVISGPTNAGKSTLLNMLLGVNRAIVTEIPGTTRDPIEEGFVLDGIPLRLVDTAGIRETTDRVEHEGIQRTRGHLEQADIHLYVLDGSQPCAPVEVDRIAQFLERPLVLVLNKRDLGCQIEADEFDTRYVVPCSLLSGEGLDQVRDALTLLLREKVKGAVAPRATISERHRKLIVDGAECLADALRLVESGDEGLMVPAAGRLREGLEMIGTATGKSYHEELLTAIFSKFCIGK